MSKFSSQTVFTTGDVAKIAKVASRTVSKWFDTGQLKGYRIPGSSDRRIPREDLIEFLKKHSMPLGPLAESQQRIILVGELVNSQVAEADLKAALTVDVQVVPCESVFELGRMLPEEGPQAVVLVQCSEAGITKALPGLQTAGAIVIGLVITEEDSTFGDFGGYQRFQFRNPIQLSELANRIEQGLLNSKKSSV